MSKPSSLTGVWVGALVTAALLALFYLAQVLFGLPFIPFDLFDWLARVLPGAVITFGIDLIVGVISTLGVGSTSDAAKTAEQTLAVLGPLLIGTLAGGLLFWGLRRRERLNLLPGLILGAVLGVVTLLISASVNQTAATGPFVSGAWILLAFVAWGAALNAVYNRSAVRPAVEKAAVEGLNRRQFLVRVAGAAAVITVVGGGVGSFISRRQQDAIVLTPGERWSNNNPPAQRGRSGRARARYAPGVYPAGRALPHRHQHHPAPPWTRRRGS